ncbi:MAG: hypothetical protein PWP48_1573 [Clostridiales bacterium]|jgi:hypothetical protein|nr:hypothetical protein [Clostridiales bacterium]
MKRQSAKWRNEIEHDRKENHEPEDMGMVIGITFGVILSFVDGESTAIPMFLGIAIGGLLGMLFRWFADRKD